MSKLIPGNQKHLTLNDRLYIEKAINEGRTFKDIAKNLCKDPTTISKEVKAHRLSVWKDHGLFVNMNNFCEHRYHCRKTNACGKIILCEIKCASCPTCNQHCPDFKRERCQRLDRAPYVCNGCLKQLTHTDMSRKYADKTLEHEDAAVEAFSQNSKTIIHLPKDKTPEESWPGFGAVIQKYRKEEGLSQPELAKIMGTSRNTITNWETDKNQPSLDDTKLCASSLRSRSMNFSEFPITPFPHLMSRLYSNSTGSSAV